MQTSNQLVRQRRPLLSAALFLVLAGTVILWFFRAPLQNRITEAAILSSDAPSPDLVEQMILKAADPRAALLAAWNSRKIIQREVTIRSLPNVIPAQQPLPPPFDALLLSATLDPDMDVRETALGILRERKDPQLAALAAAQLRDPDQQLRLLGLYQFKFVSPAIGVLTIIPLLDDSNPPIITKSLNLLEHWSGEKFGVKFGDVATLDETKTGMDEYKAGGYEKVKAGVQRAKAWWKEHQSEFPPVHLQVPQEAFSAQLRLPAPDFQLRTIDGEKVRLSDFRGKVVLINFWTTWCTACVSEIPELIALQKKYPDKLVILGVSLDGVPDDDQDDGGKKPAATELKHIHDKVARTVKARGINYPVLLDEHDAVGGSFNGGELPTTVIVDAQGNICRRFIGARSLPEFEAMLDEAGLNHPNR